MRNKTRLFLWFGLVVLTAGLAVFIYLSGDLPEPQTLITRASPDTTKILDRNGRLLFEVLDPRAGRRTRLALAEIPEHLKQAVISVEDANYYEHPGVDVTAVARAGIQAVTEGRIVSGASTITQQLARELLLSREERESRTLSRKLREMLLAWRLERTFSKDLILELYLNEVYFGQLAYGVEAAARTYFSKPARDLDLAEAALLAGLIQSPSAYNPLVHLDAALERQRVVLGLMVKRGAISQEQAQFAENESLHLAPLEGGASKSGAVHFKAPHFVTYVLSLLEATYGPETVNHGGLRVVTSLDLDLQEHAEAIVRQKLGELQRRHFESGAPDHNIHDAAVVVLHPASGEILAMVGSADYWDDSIDGAVNVALAKRQPGSAIKPITYAAALARGMTAATVIADVPTTFLTRENEPYAPQNYDRAWQGPISLRRALATSSNLVAVKVLDRIGLPAMIDTARQLGITTFNDTDRYGLALTLGGGEVRLLELTGAFAALGNGGKVMQPKAILDIQRQGQRLAPEDVCRSSLECKPADLTGVSPQIAFLITNILSDDSARISAFGEDSALNLGRPAAAKTGTTSDFRDNWTVGYTPDLAVGVWAGNADNEPMYLISGITGAAPIWRDIMELTLRDKPPTEFTRPEGLVQLEICEASGLLPTELCPRRKLEYFIAGTGPTEVDDAYAAFEIDSATGLLWEEGCQGPARREVWRLYPPEALDWARRQGYGEPPKETCQGRAVFPALPDLPGLPSGGLKVTLPPPNSVYMLSPQLPLEMQRIEVAAQPMERGLWQITLWLNGQPLAVLDQPPYRVLWKLESGEHEARATGRDPGGRTWESAPVRFRVLDAP